MTSSGTIRTAVESGRAGRAGPSDAVISSARAAWRWTYSPSDEDNLLGKVGSNFHRHGVPVEVNNVHLVRGLFQDTLRVGRAGRAGAHRRRLVPTRRMTRRQRIEPHLVAHGVLVIDDYDDWSGCRKAVDEQSGDKRDRYEFVRKARLHIMRKPSR